MAGSLGMCCWRCRPCSAIVLSYLSPDHMNTLFTEPMGKKMLMGAGVMQTVGYFWIEQVIKIEV